MSRETATYQSPQETRPTAGDIVARGKAIYERDIRSKIEIPENVGKVLVIDIDTGKYVMGNDVNGFDDYEVDLNALRAFPDHHRFGMRIGYNAADAAGVVLQRIDRDEDKL